MIVFQVKGHSHRLSRLNGKEKDVIKIFSTYSTKYTEDTDRAYDVHNYDAQQHRAGQIISPLTLQTITIAQMLSVGGEGGLKYR